MATVQKTTLKRYNGTDWDPVYLANSADISYLGKGFSVTPGDGFTSGQSIQASENIADLMALVINNLTKIDKVTVPAIQNGSTITAIDASKLTGIISRTNLPADVGGKGVEVASEGEKNDLTSDDVNVGDIVKVTGGKVYLVTSTADQVQYLELSDTASEVAWSRITGTPTTLTGYGITDAVAASEKVTAGGLENAGKILVLDDNGKLNASITGDAATLGGNAPAYYAKQSDMATAQGNITTNTQDITQLKTDIKNIDAAWLTSGTISIDRLPATAIERMYVAENADALQSLTNVQVQNGDTVKLADSGKMYFVIDDTKLGTGDYMQAFSEYTAGVAGSVNWSGVQNKPTTVDGYGITDAVKTTDLVDAAAGNAGKILKINTNGKLTADITGDAGTLGGHAAEYFAKASDVTALQGTVSTNTSDINTLKTTVGNEGSGLVKDVNDLKTSDAAQAADIVNLKNGTAITALAASKLTGTVSRTNLPTDISGRLIQKASLEEAYGSLTKENASKGDLVKLTDGKVYVIVDDNNLAAAEGYVAIVDTAAATINWSQITGVPTSLAAMGWSDAVTTAMLVDTASPENVGKLLKIGADGKLAASITGDAATLGGNAPAYYAKQSDMTSVQSTVGQHTTDIAQLKTDVKNIDASWLTTGVISIDRLPHGALERCVVVADDTARLALTTEKVQTGDTVKVTQTGKMYFVVDDQKLNQEAGYEVYTAGTASAVDWSGVQNKPTTLNGYGITDAVAASEKVTAANAGNAGKILVLNAAGKLDVDITGSVAWEKITDKPTSSVAQIDEAVAAATHTNRTVLDALTDVSGRLTYNGTGLATKPELDQVALGSLKVVANGSLPGDAASGQLVLEAIQ